MGEKGNAAGAAVETDEGFSLPGFAEEQAEKTVDDLRGRGIDGVMGMGKTKDEEKDDKAEGEDDSAGKI